MQERLDVAAADAASALVFGKPLEKWPEELFIPPNALKIFLAGFEGPLDLLLYLIRRQNIDVLDIPMRVVTEQYLSYIALMHEEAPDLTAEYLLMAAVLIEIKSRLLLPQPPAAEEDEPEDPRAELVRRLLAYEQIKLAAAELDERPRAGRDFGWARITADFTAPAEPPIVTLADLVSAGLSVIARQHQNRSHRVEKPVISLRSRMQAVLMRLQALGGTAVFPELFSAPPPLAVFVTDFIALLELAKEGKITLQQDTQFADITIRTV